ncbi:DUF4407 domain-containing protein [Chitinophagaceae bacterium 26-R-25]|nr:DUF4407 domain-containing protein [Chitinophagaceae bacterium 26-R-25]
MKVRDYYVTPDSNRIMRLLWQAAGGDRYLLERATYSDQVKYMCLGGIVSATGAMAALAGGYAFYTIFSPRGSALEDASSTIVAIQSVFFGLIWGLIIFNIDRFIVTSTGKGDGTEAITWDEFKGAIPRIIMGAIIALTISKPVEIRMFKTEIDIRLKEKQIEQQTEYIEKTRKNFQIELDRNAKDLAKYEQEIQDKIARHKFLESQYIEEARIVTVGPRALALKAQMDKVDQEIRQDKQDSEYLKLIKEKENIEKRLNADLQVSQKTADGLDGLLERIKLSHEVSGWVISLFITLLFMAIELTPVFFKLMLTKTPYDYLAENRDDLIKAENGIEVRYDYYKDKVGQERHLVIHHESEKMIYEKIKLTEIQKELTDYAVEQYKNREKKKIDENLDAYIKNVQFDESSN